MTNKETRNRNIGLTFDFLREVVKDPSILNKIPDGSTLEFIEKDFSVIEKKSRTKSNRKYMRVKSKFDLI